MKICSNCFNDSEIKAYIDQSSSEESFCECCKSKGATVNSEDLIDFFTGFLNLYTYNEDGRNIIEFIQSEWNIFSSDDNAKQLINFFILNGNFSFSVTDNVSYKPEIIDFYSVWKKLKKEVREEKRFFSDLESLEFGSSITANSLIKKDETLYRSRILPNDLKFLDKKDMGTPPKELASAGRANPIGIPYLYLCNNIDTTFYEVRAVYLDKVCVGTFKVMKDLNIVDFSNKINLFYAYTNSDKSLLDILKVKILLESISEDLSKPLRRFDTEIEYVPTQLICEYCKINGADGIRFNSSLHEGGVNIVLFDSSDAECIDVKSHEIKRVVIENKPTI